MRVPAAGHHDPPVLAWVVPLVEPTVVPLVPDVLVLLEVELVVPVELVDDPALMQAVSATVPASQPL